MTDELPPLPEPALTQDYCSDAQAVYFTASQMRAYAQEAARQERERCLKICDEFSDDYMQQARGGDRSGASDHKACAAVEIADEIRSRSPGDAALRRMHEIDVEMGEEP